MAGRSSPRRQTDELIADARTVAADFLGCSSEEVVFGANTTTINFLLAHALARTLTPGDEIIVTELDHDANVVAMAAGRRRPRPRGAHGTAGPD